MNMRAYYVPEANTKLIPHDIAGEYYYVYVLPYPLVDHDQDDARYFHDNKGYVDSLLQILRNDNDRAIAVLEQISRLRYEDTDEREVIFEIAKLINRLPVLFLGLSPLLRNYAIELRDAPHMPDPHPVALAVDMSHLDDFFRHSQVKNDADIEYIMRNVNCFREFAKRFLFECGNSVPMALSAIQRAMSLVPPDTRQRVTIVQTATDCSEQEALQRLVFCNMNPSTAIENFHQDRKALRIVQLIEGCTEDRAQAALKHWNNNMALAMDDLLRIGDNAALNVTPPTHVLSAEQQAHVLATAVQRFMDTTGEDAASARVWLHKYGANGDLAVQQFLVFDEAATRAGTIVIDATAATLGLRSIDVPGGRGHCFYLAMSQQLSLHSVFLTFQQLRGIAADDIGEAYRADTFSPIYSIYSSVNPPSTQTFRDWCLTMATEVRNCGDKPMWADNLSIWSLLNGLFKKGTTVKLRIIASRQETAAARRVLEMEPIGASTAAGTVLTLTICHLYGRHYLGTVPIGTTSGIRHENGSFELPEDLEDLGDFPDISRLHVLPQFAAAQAGASSTSKPVVPKPPSRKRDTRVPAKSNVAVAAVAAADTPKAPAAAAATPKTNSRKKKAKPSWPGPIDEIHSALREAEEAWKQHPDYELWLSERNANAADPTRCAILYTSLEAQRTSLITRIHAKIRGDSTIK